VYFTFKFLCKFYSTQVHVYLKLGKNWLMFKESHIRIFKKKDKRTINDLQNITHKTKVTRTQLKTGVNSVSPEG
jgi:hypothetical protein